MLWHKSWLDTRWRFLTGLGLLTCAAVVVVLAYPRATSLVHALASDPRDPAEMGGELGRRVRDGLALLGTYNGYVLSQWYHQTPLEFGTLFAILLGSGGLFAQGSGGRLFTLALPVSRNAILGARAATGLVEWLVLSFVPSLLLPVLSPSVGQSYGLASALAHGVCIFVAGAVFFCLALLLSTLFDDIWRPLLIAIAIALVVDIFDVWFRNGIYTVMSGESYFYAGQLPWLGLATSAALSAAMLGAASFNLARRDF